MSDTSILLIDDDDSLRRVTEFTLHEAGYRVVCASSGEEGIRLFGQEEPAVVITDMQMPGLSGEEVLHRVKQQRPETAVIVITAYGTVEKAVEAMKLGAFDYLTKPFGRDELRLTVERALAFQGLTAENRRLRETLADRFDFSRLIGNSEQMQRVFDVVRRVAASEATVLLIGESGTGKELVARALHHGSDRREGPFVAVNCAALPADLLESELFGHRRGAFTGAVKDRQGKFAQADGGTLFLDEIGELPLELQPKLLRALQERVVEPLGGTPRRIDVRLVAATNRNLDAAMREGRFREDLYYRLAVIPLGLPTLRQRRDDIPLLLRHFLVKHGASAVKIEEEALRQLVAHDWPGNVRELENLVERLVLLRRDDTIGVADLPWRSAPRESGSGVLNLPPEGYSLEELEREAVVTALRRTGWNQTKAAAFLRIPRHTLLYRMEKFQIHKE